MAVLASLVAQAGQVVTKEALLETVWPETVVTEGVLKGCIRQIRQALGETGATRQYIATVHRRGYRFVAPVTVIDPSERRGTGAPLQREALAPTSQKAGQAVPDGLSLPGEVPRPIFSRYANRLPTPATPLIDVRSPGEYSGELLHMPDYPQEGALRGGHIPGAASVPWGQAVAPDGTFKSTDELRALYEGKAGLTPTDEVIAYCRIGER